MLLPPVESACVGERRVVAGTYVPRDGEKDKGGDGQERKEEEGKEERLADLVVCVDEPEELVPFATWDPDQPEKRATVFSKYSNALRVTLNEGDMLYLPALWYVPGNPTSMWKDRVFDFITGTTKYHSLALQKRSVARSTIGTIWSLAGPFGRFVGLREVLGCCIRNSKPEGRRRGGRNANWKSGRGRRGLRRRIGGIMGWR